MVVHPPKIQPWPPQMVGDCMYDCGTGSLQLARIWKKISTCQKQSVQEKGARPLEYKTWAQQHKEAKTIFRGFLGSKWRPKNRGTYSQNSWPGWRTNEHVWQKGNWYSNTLLRSSNYSSSWIFCSFPIWVLGWIGWWWSMEEQSFY